MICHALMVSVLTVAVIGVPASGCSAPPIGVHQKAADADTTPTRLFPVRSSGPGRRWAFIDQNGTLVTEYRFWDAWSDRIALAKEGSKRHIIDARGQITFTSDSTRVGPDGSRTLISRVSEGLAEVHVRDYTPGLVVESTRSTRYIDSSGTTVLGPFDFYAGPFTGGIAKIIDGEARGVLNRRGQVALQPTQDRVLIDSHSGHFAVCADGETTVYDSDGHVVAELPFVAHRFAHGFLFATEDRFDAAADLLGRIIVSGHLDEIGEIVSLSADRLVARFATGNGTQIWLLNESGERIARLPVSHTRDVRSFTCGLAAFRDPTSGLYGFFDTQGRVAIEPMYSRARPFEVGRAVVTLPNGRWLLIDAEGTVIAQETREPRDLVSSPETHPPMLTEDGLDPADSP